MDITADNTAEITNVSRNTVNHYYGYFRTLVLRNQEGERERFLSKTKTEVDESYFGPTRVRGKRGRGASKKIAVIGLLKRDGKVFTSPVKNCERKELLPIILARVSQGVDIYTDGWRSYDALAVYGFNHKKVHHSEDEFCQVEDRDNHINGIESFWSYAKRRLAKFNGLSKIYFQDHLLETEWRFNNRGIIEKTLKRLIKNNR